MMRRSYKYRLYRCDKRDKHLRHKIFVASTIWNHFIALQRRYYRLTGRYIALNRMNKHVLKLRHLPRFKLWQDLHSPVLPRHHRLANKFKGFTSRMLRQKYPELRSRLPSMWSRSYYIGTIGHVPDKTVRAYVEAQKRS